MTSRNGSTWALSNFKQQVDLPELTRGRILKRYKRFLADVEIPGVGVVTAHCPNTGSMESCWAPSAPVELSHSDNPARKLEWTLERVDMGAGWVGVNTLRVNSIVGEGIREGRIHELAGYEKVQAEPKCAVAGYERSRLDFKLTDEAGREVWVEVKNTTLLRGDWVEFPDAVTTRGQKHLDVLSQLVAENRRAVLIFAINRPEGKGFKPAASIDPEYARKLNSVMVQGVEVLVVRLHHRDRAIVVESSARYQ